MANTTNYNWETPDDTDLVKDGAAAIRTLGSSVDTTTKALNPSTTLGDIEYRSATANTNTRLGIGTSGQVLTVAAGVPTWATSDDANAIQNAIVDAKGDLIAASAADTPARLAVGANGTVLTADSAETTGLKWTTVGGGKVLQVVATTTSTQVSTTSTTYTDTGLSLAITPTLASSKILVLISQPMYTARTADDAGGGTRLLRDATTIYDVGGTGFYTIYMRSIGANTASELGNIVCMSYLDSPATTSATTYKTQMRVYSAGSSPSIYAQIGTATSSIVLLEIGA
jgi:hypothetical protein